MKKNLLKYFILILIPLYYISYLNFFKNFNDSVITSFKIIFVLLISFLILGAIISKLIFRITINNKKLALFNLNNFDKKKLSQKILISSITLFIYFAILYFFLYKYIHKLPIIKNYETGILNSIKYISKIFFLSLPLYSFELTYLEYCNFFKLIFNPILLVFSKLIIWFIISIIVINLLQISEFLYVKLAINFIFSIYYIISLKKITKLCSYKTNIE